MDWLKEPLTPIEEAWLSQACQDVLTEAGMSLLRRLMFDNAAMRTTIENLRSQLGRHPSDVSGNYPEV